MSPEQADWAAGDVDTSSDVYSLGVVLYELLAGAPPFDEQRMRDAGMSELLRIIREEEAIPMTAKLTGLGGRAVEIARCRRTDPAALRRLVRGDLNWIDLALAYLSQGKFAQSEPLAREIFASGQKNQTDEWKRFRSESLLGASLAGEKKYAEAEPLLLEGYQGMIARKDRMGVAEQDHLDGTAASILALYRDWGKPDKASKWAADMEEVPLPNARTRRQCPL